MEYGRSVENFSTCENNDNFLNVKWRAANSLKDSHGSPKMETSEK
jgi:hypothetical protein